MTLSMIDNEADFQRHLNGCERRLNAVTKSLQTIEALSQRLLSNNSQKTRELYFNRLNDIISQIKYLYSAMLTLDQCSYSCNRTKRLNYLKTNLEKNQMKLEQIQKYAQTQFGYEYKQNDIEPCNNEQQEQIIILISNNPNDEILELDLVHERSVLVDHLEKDLTDINETFNDMNRIIHEQGHMVDSIGKALTTANNIIDDATEAIQTTVNVKKRSKHIKWILITVLFCAFLFIILIIFITLRLAFHAH